jgi:isoleucyl-tRNA synthetase
MREQIRLWFYSQLFMSVVLTGRAPYRKVLGYEKMLDETGREMHGSWGNMIDAEDAFARMGADVMRWQYCAQPPSQNLLFGFGPGYEIQRKLLTLWNTASFFVRYANIAGFTPSYDALASAPAPSDVELDRWLVARTQQLVGEATEGYEQYMTVTVLRAYESYVEDLSNWYVRLSRRRFWNDDETALGTLWWSLVTGLRTVAPIVPFLAEHLWARLVRDVCPDAPRSVHLAGWPSVGAPDRALLEEMAAVRQVVELGRQARATAKLRTRQPLRTLVVEGADAAAGHLDVVADELRVKDVVLGTIDATELRVRPNLKVLGPRLGSAVADLRKALDAGEFEPLPDGGFRAAGHDLTADEVLVERTQKEGWAVASSPDGVSIALDTTLDDELVLEGRVNDLIHAVNNRRKEMGLELTDRIRLTLAAPDADLLFAADTIAAETLAVSVDAGSTTDLTITKA